MVDSRAPSKMLERLNYSVSPSSQTFSMEICLWCEDNQGWCPAAGEGEQEDPMLTPGPFSAPYITSPSDRVSSLGLLFIHPPTKVVRMRYQDGIFY